MVFTDYAKQRILWHYHRGLRPPQIQRLLRDTEGIISSKRGIAKFIDRYLASGTIARRSGSGRQPKITDEVRKIVEEAMRCDDETTACQLHVILKRQGYSLSLSTILRCRSQLGWTFRGSAYCQVIREANKAKRLEWARNNLENDFADVVFTDECSIQMETHRRFSCRKTGEPPKNKPRYMQCVYLSLHKLNNIIMLLNLSW